MKSIYTFRSDDEKICISFELNNKEKDNNLRDGKALEYLGDEILKDYDKARNDFYMDDVVEVMEKWKLK